MIPDLRPLLAPSSVAVLGASPRRRMARTVVTNLVRCGFAGGVYPVHPAAEPVEGLPAYASITALPEVPDCAVIALSPENTLAAFRNAARAGVRAAVLLGSGFAEAGEAGRSIQREIEELAREAGIAVCGPNCLGLVAPALGVTLTGYHLPDDLAAGAVAAVVQSGSVFWSLAHNTRGIRFNTLVSSGNEAVLTAADFLDHALDDPSTRVIVAFLESVRDGDRFLELAARVRRSRIPLVVLKIGRSEAGRASVIAHSGALAGSDAIFSAVCRQEGIVRVDTIDELYDVCELLLAGRLPRGERVGVVTDSGGEKTLILDWGERVGLRFPPPSPPTAAALRTILAPYVPVSNPLDAWGSGNYAEIYPAALKALAEDDAIDVVVLGTDLIRDTEEAALYGQAMLNLREATAKPVAVVANQANGIDAVVAGRLRQAGVPVLQGTEYGLRAIRRAADYARFLARPDSVPVPPAAQDVAWLSQEIGAAPRVVGELTAKRWLARFGVPVAREAPARTLDEARRAAAAIGYPVALKALGRGLEHKSDVGALALGLDTPEALVSAWESITIRVARLGAAASLDLMLVQEMVSAGLELLVGVTVDPTFGPILSVGLGGVFVELLDDVVYARPPIDERGARELLAQLRGARVLGEFRGRGPRDVAAASGAIAAVGRFALAAGARLAAIDVNPLIVLDAGNGARAVDALIVLRDA